jgi:hypothetical protein
MGEAYSPIRFRNTKDISEKTGLSQSKRSFEEKGENLLSFYARI